MVAASEVPISTVREGTAAIDLADMIFRAGVIVTGATYYGDIDSAGSYSGGGTLTPGVTPSDTGVILSTGNAESFTKSKGRANPLSGQGYPGAARRTLKRFEAQLLAASRAD